MAVLVELRALAEHWQALGKYYAAEGDTARGFAYQGCGELLLRELER